MPFDLTSLPLVLKIVGCVLVEIAQHCSDEHPKCGIHVNAPGLQLPACLQCESVRVTAGAKAFRNINGWGWLGKAIRGQMKRRVLR